MKIDDVMLKVKFPKNIPLEFMAIVKNAFIERLYQLIHIIIS